MLWPPEGLNEQFDIRYKGPVCRTWWQSAVLTASGATEVTWGLAVP